MRDDKGPYAKTVQGVGGIKGRRRYEEHLGDKIGRTWCFTRSLMGQGARATLKKEEDLRLILRVQLWCLGWEAKTDVRDTRNSEGEQALSSGYRQDQRESS